jgi:hypothetical protein
VRAQAAVRADKHRHLIRGVVKHDEIGASVAVHVPRFQVVIDPKIQERRNSGCEAVGNFF